MTKQIRISDLKNRKEIGINDKSIIEIRKHEDGRVFVIKITTTDCEDKYFKNEIKYLSRVKHENIMKFYGAMKNSTSKGLMITEYADHGTLYDYLYGICIPMYLNNAFTPSITWMFRCGMDYQDRYITYSDKLSWMLQCAKGVAYLHELTPRIFHNDLKPRHLLLSNNLQTLKICDFSTATESDPSNTRESLHHNLCAEKTEIYNFGIILWETFIAYQKPRVLDVKDSEVIEALIKLCCDDFPVNRPRMRTIVNILDGIYQKSLKAGEKVYWIDLQVKEEIGHGAFGDVFKGIWKAKQGDRDIAIKKIKNINQEVDLHKELKYMSLVSHGNIVKLFGSTVDHQNKTLAVMEYADCGSLYDFLHYKPLMEVTNLGKLNWLLQCAMAVDYLHGMSPSPILHRDLKSQNLLLFNKNMTVKICDFGTVRPLQTEMTKEIGTAGYMAPEVCIDEPYTEKCDVYSFGILGWEILSRKKPYYHLNHRNHVVIMNQTCQNKRPSMDDIPINEQTNPLRIWIQQCWDQDPTKRPTINEMVIRLGIDPLSYKDLLLRSLPAISENDFTERT